MPKFCAVFGCSNRSSRERDRSFFRVPKVVLHKGDNFRKLTEKRRQAWIANLNLKSSGAESVNARVCSDHFVRGSPSAAKDVDSIDWAPTMQLGYVLPRPATEVREEKLKSREAAAAALLDLSTFQNSESRKDAGCQTELTAEHLERMEDVLKRALVELTELRSQAINPQLVIVKKEEEEE